MNAKQRRDARRNGTPSFGTGPAALLMAMGAAKATASMQAVIRPAIAAMEDDMATLRVHVQYLLLDNQCLRQENEALRARLGE